MPAQTFRITEPYNDGSAWSTITAGFDFVGELEIPRAQARQMPWPIVKTVGDQEIYADVPSRAPSKRRASRPARQHFNSRWHALHDQYLALLGNTDDSLAFYRLYDLGKRTSDDTADFQHIAVGSRGVLAGWDYDASLVYLGMTAAAFPATQARWKHQQAAA